MRRTVVVLAAVAGMTLLSGCGGDPQRVAGAARPAGGVSATSPAPTTVPASSPAGNAPSDPATTPPIRATSAAPGRTTAATAKLVLGPAGLGALKLGMTRAQAVNTGMLTADGQVDGGAGCDSGYKPKAAGEADAPVFLSDLGLVSITAYPGVATPEGIKLGSSATAVEKAYPDFESFTEDGAEGRGWASVPGNGKAVYNISISDGKVTHMNLQLRTQNCYE